MTIDTWLHFVHVLGACIWLGGGLMLVVIGIRLRRTGDPAAIADFGSAVRYGARVLGPAWIVVLGTGVWMVLISAEWKFTQLWVLLGLGFFALAFLIGLVFVARIGVELVNLSGVSDGSKNSSGLLRRWIAGYSLVLICLLLAVWDMVFKPGL